MIFSKAHIALLAFFVFCAPAFAGAAAEENSALMTLAEAVRIGVYSNPDYGVAASDDKATKEDLTLARSLYLPSVDLIAESGRETLSEPTLRERSNLWSSKSTITLTQLLFDGGGASNQIARQRYRVESSANRLQEVTEFVGLDIVQAYLEVMRQRGLLGISRENIDKHAILLRQINEGVAAGTMNKGDRAQAQVRLNAARANVAVVERDLRSAEALFLQKVGQMPPREMAPPYIPPGELPATVEEAVHQTLASSLTLSVLNADVKAAKAEYDTSASAFYPKVQVQVSGTEGSNLSGFEGNTNTASALAVMKWNLFSGGADKARRSQSMFRLEGAQERQMQAARQVERDVRETWAGMKAAEQRRKEFIQQVKANKTVVRVYLDQFSLNRRTLLDVLDAQDALFASRLDHVNAIYTQIFSIYRIFALQGRILKVLNIEPPPETVKVGSKE